MSVKDLFRLYREEGPSVRRRRGRKRSTGTRAPFSVPQGWNRRWSLDFVSGALDWGRRIRVLAVVDDFTREALALVVDTSISGARGARELDALSAVRGRRGMIVSDKRTKLTSRAVLDWTNRTGIEWHDIAPGKPQNHALIESFNARPRSECNRSDVALFLARWGPLPAASLIPGAAHGLALLPAAAMANCA